MTNLAEKANIFVGMQTSPETRRAYGRDVAMFFSWIDEHGKAPEDATEEDAIRFRDLLVSKYAPNGAARVYTTIKGLYRFARMVNPFDSVKGPKRVTNTMPRVPADEDVDALVMAATTNPQRALIIALLLNGLRASEVCGLLKPDIERHLGTTILRVVGKGEKERMLPATIEVEQAMVRYNTLATLAQTNSAYVVSDRFGKALNYRRVEHAVYKTAEYAGISGMHPHALRHHYATRLIRAGVSELHVQLLLGHESVATTQRYVGLNLGDLIRAVQKDPRNDQKASAVA